MIFDAVFPCKRGYLYNIFAEQHFYQFLIQNQSNAEIQHLKFYGNNKHQVCNCH